MEISNLSPGVRSTGEWTCERHLKGGKSHGSEPPHPADLRLLLVDGARTKSHSRPCSPHLLHTRVLHGAGNTEPHLSTCLRAPWWQALLFSASPESTSQALTELWQKLHPPQKKKIKPSICPGQLWYRDGVALSPRPPPSRGPGTPSLPSVVRIEGSASAENFMSSHIKALTKNTIKKLINWIDWTPQILFC